MFCWLSHATLGIAATSQVLACSTPFPLPPETKIDDVPFFFDGSFKYEYHKPAASESILGMYTDTYKPGEGRELGHM